MNNFVSKFIIPTLGINKMYPFWGYWSIPIMGLSSILFFKPFTMSEDDNKVVTLKVRVTPEFREKLVDIAKENNRSMNAEIVYRLERSFDRMRFALKGIKTEYLISILAERLAEKGCELRIAKREKIEESARIVDEIPNLTSDK